MDGYWLKDQIDNLGAVDISGANATTAYQPGDPMDIKRIIMVCTTATTGAAGSVITFARRDADAGNSADLGSFTIPSGVGADSVLYVDVGRPSSTGDSSTSDGSTVFSNEPDLIQVNPGQEFLLTSNGGADAGNVTFYVQFQRPGFVPGSRPATATRLNWTAA